MPDASTNRATNRATDRATNRGGNAPINDEWLSVAGYAEMFETASPSVITLDTAPNPDEVSSWLGSAGNYTLTPPGSAPTFPASTQANGIDGVQFYAPATRLASSLGVASTDLYAIFFVLRYSTSSYKTLMDFVDSGSTSQIRFRIISNDKVRHFRNAVSSVHTSAATLTPGAVSRLMFAYDGTNSILRLEGSAEESQAIAAGSHDAGQAVFGSEYSPINPFDGILYVSPIYGGASGVPSSSSDRAQVWADLGTRFGL